MVTSASVRREPGLRVRVVLAGAACVAFSTWTGLRLGGTFTTRVADDLALFLAAAIAGWACIAPARRRHGRHRAGWALVGASSFLWAGGQLAWSYYQLVSGTEVPFPGVPDIGYAGSIPLAAAGILAFGSSSTSWTSRVRISADGLIITLAMLFVGWAFFLGPAVQARSGPAVAQALSIFYPAGYVAVIAIAFIMLAGTSSERGLAIGLVTAGLLVNAVASASYGALTLNATYYTGHPMDVGWAASFLLMALGGWKAGRRVVASETGEAIDRTPSRASLAVPYIPVSAALVCALVVVVTDGHLGPFLAITLAALVVMMVLRQLMTLVENASLTRGLEDTVEARTLELRRSEERFRGLVQHSTDMLLVVNSDQIVSYVSPAMEELVGVHFVGRPLREILEQVHPDDVDGPAGALIATVTCPGASQRVELRIAGAEGSWRSVELVSNNLLEHPAIRGVVINGRDVTERRKAEEALAYQALHDPLTGLANRVLLHDRLEMALARLSRNPATAAVIFIDLDHFKLVNDGLGHHVGDELLAIVADRLRSAIRPGDTVARFGGDEFVLLCEGLTGEEEVRSVARRVAELLALPIPIRDREQVVTASIGIAVTTDPDTPPDALLRDADSAMYEAKAHGRSRHEVFDQTMRERSVHRLETEQALRIAIEHDELVVHYQPEIDLHDGKLRGVEALVRWQRPDHGLVLPQQFIGVAEDSGLIAPLGLCVLSAACRQLAQWVATPGEVKPSFLAVNVAASQLTAEFVRDVAAIVHDTGVDPTSLSFEITESAVMENLDAARSTLFALRDLGVTIGIDDFGTGYSSLSYIKRLPVSFVKVDRSFVDGIGKGPEDEAIVTAIVRMAQSLGLMSIGEGIENQAQAERLRALGCDLGQGFLWSRALPPEDLDAWIRTRGAAVVLAAAGSDSAG